MLCVSKKIIYIVGIFALVLMVIWSLQWTQKSLAINSEASFNRYCSLDKKSLCTRSFLRPSCGSCGLDKICIKYNNESQCVENNKVVKEYCEKDIRVSEHADGSKVKYACGEGKTCVNTFYSYGNSVFQTSCSPKCSTYDLESCFKWAGGNDLTVRRGGNKPIFNKKPYCIAYQGNLDQAYMKQVTCTNKNSSAYHCELLNEMSCDGPCNEDFSECEKMSRIDKFRFFANDNTQFQKYGYISGDLSGNKYILINCNNDYINAVFRPTCQNLKELLLDNSNIEISSLHVETNNGKINEDITLPAGSVLYREDDLFGILLATGNNLDQVKKLFDFFSHDY